MGIRILGLAGLIGIGACSQTGNGTQHYACQGRYEAAYEGAKKSTSYSASFGIEVKEYNLPWGRGAYINTSMTSDVYNPEDKKIDSFYTNDSENTEFYKAGHVLRVERGTDSEKRFGEIIILDTLAQTIHYTSQAALLEENFNGNCTKIR